MGKKLVAVDLFCGGGGTSTGMLMACAALGIDPADVDLTAVNHWQRAIETHSANHPHARHLCERIEGIQPERVVPGGRADLLWASPECIHHSRARGKAPKNDQSRSQAWTVLDWVQRLQPKSVLIENVMEFANWGPLYVDGPNAGQVIPSKRGDVFRAWCAALESHNYRLQWRILNCADYGDATTRQRFFLIARRGNRRVSWPQPSHAQNGGADLFGSCPSWRPASEIIDWTMPGHSIFLSRDEVRASGLRLQRPLAPNTIRRIEAGINKFWGEWAKPFMVVLRGTNKGQIDGSCGKLEEPIPTVTASGGHVGLVSPFFVRFNGSHAGGKDGDGRHSLTNVPLPVQDTSNRYGLCSPFIIPQHAGGTNRDAAASPVPTITSTATGVGLLSPFLAHINHGTPDGGHGRRTCSIDGPLQTVTTSHGLSLIRPFLVSYYGTGQALDITSPLDTVTTDDRFGLVRPRLVEMGGQRYLLDILFRMLTPAELAAAHSFPSDYIWTGKKSEIVKQIGNSVPVRTAAALCASQLTGAAA